MTCHTTWYFSAHLRSSHCPSRGQWRMLGWSSCTNHPLHSVSTWLLSRTWWAGSPLSHVFWLVTPLRQSHTCSASARIQASRSVALTLLQLTEGGAAMSMRSTRGCGSLGAASPAWVVWQSRRLLRGRKLHARESSSVVVKLAGVARRIRPDLKWKVVVTFVCVYHDVLVCTCMYLYAPGPCSSSTF